MSDGITDATKTDQEIFEAWKKNEVHKFLSYIPTNELVEELKKRWKKQSPLSGMV